MQSCISPADSTATHRLFASVKSRLVLPLWYRLTWVVPDRRLLNWCVCVSVCLSVCCCSHHKPKTAADNNVDLTNLSQDEQVAALLRRVTELEKRFGSVQLILIQCLCRFHQSLSCSSSINCVHHFKMPTSDINNFNMQLSLTTECAILQQIFFNKTKSNIMDFFVF